MFKGRRGWSWRLNAFSGGPLVQLDAANKTTFKVDFCLNAFSGGPLVQLGTVTVHRRSDVDVSMPSQADPWCNTRRTKRLSTYVYSLNAFSGGPLVQLQTGETAIIRNLLGLNAFSGGPLVQHEKVPKRRRKRDCLNAFSGGPLVQPRCNSGGSWCCTKVSMPSQADPWCNRKPAIRARLVGNRSLNAFSGGPLVQLPGRSGHDTVGGSQVSMPSQADPWCNRSLSPASTLIYSSSLNAFSGGPLVQQNRCKFFTTSRSTSQCLLRRTPGATLVPMGIGLMLGLSQCLLRRTPGATPAL